MQEKSISGYIENTEIHLRSLSQFEFSNYYRRINQIGSDSKKERPGKQEKENFYKPDTRVVDGIESKVHNFSDFIAKIHGSNCYIAVIPHCHDCPTHYHVHDFFELFYVAKGSCIHRCKGYDYNLTAGDFCFWQYNAPHCIIPKDDSFIGLNIVIDKKKFENIFFELLSTQTVISDYFRPILYGKSSNSMIIFQTHKDEDLKYTIFKMYEESTHRSDYTNYLLSNYLNLIFIQLLREHLDHIQTNDNTKYDPQALAIYKYIQDHYQTVTLAQICQHFNYSTSYFSRLIKNSFHMNFSELLQRERLRHAVLMLETTQKPISEIAQEINCTDSSHFSRIFIRQYQMSPGKYRKMYQKKCE